MENRLPSRFNPATLAQSTANCLLDLPVSHFKRFSSLLMDDSGTVRARVLFGLAEGGQVTASGQLSCEVVLRCQRCLDQMTLAIDSAFQFGFVSSEEAAEQLTDTLDPVLLDEHGEIHAVDFLEDELILQLPLSHLHSDGLHCLPLDEGSVEIAEPSNADASTHQPFSTLGKLLKD